MLSEFIDCSLPIFINTNRRTVKIERRNSNLWLDEFKSVTMKLEVVNNLGRQRASAADNRNAKAWVKFFGRAGATDRLAALKHERLESRPGEIVSGDQAVVAGADDDDVSLDHRKKISRRLSRICSDSVRSPTVREGNHAYSE